ncbi:hypothetical protein BDZ97DRAFT_1837405, partial [Flammula alnicola]
QQQQQQQQQHPQQYQQQQQQQQQQHSQQMPFARTTAIVPTNIDALPAPQAYAPSEPERIPSVRNDTIAEINTHCSILYNFASRYAQMQHNNIPHAHPSQQELEEMSQRAQAVVRLLEDLRRM